MVLPQYVCVCVCVCVCLCVFLDVYVVKTSCMFCLTTFTLLMCSGYFSHPYVSSSNSIISLPPPDQSHVCLPAGVAASQDQDFGTANLHVEVSDVVSVLVYVGVAKGNGVLSKTGNIINILSNSFKHSQ